MSQQAAVADVAALETRVVRGGRVVEFLLTGGATLLLFPLVWLLRRAVGLDAAEYAVGFVTFHAAFVINDPHFAVTYLLFYRDGRRRAFGDAFPPAQRARWLVAGVAVPIVLAGWGALAISRGSAPLLGLLIQAMFLLVGWHYVKQGFGVLSVLSARSGVTLTPWERRAALAHGYAGWAHAWASPFDPGKEVEEKGVVYRTLAHPAGLEAVTGIAFGLSAIVLLAVLVREARRAGRRLPVAPLSGFLVTVWLWTVYTWIDPLMVYLIPALHSVQYLFFVALLRRNEAREQEGPPAFGRPASVRLAVLAASAIGLGWLVLRGAPAFLDALRLRGTGGAPALTDLGPTPWLAACFAFVNIHHYFMDHVIWRRENPETRYLRG